jgi:hypothetical protein
MKTIVITVYLVLLCVACSDNKKSREAIETPLTFLLLKGNLYSVKKVVIPNKVIDILSEIDHKHFEIGDLTDVGKFNFSDVCCSDYQYNKMLHFVILNDSICLIAYKEGGRGSYDVIDYVKFKGRIKHLRYKTTEKLNDTIKLRSYLTSRGSP